MLNLTLSILAKELAGAITMLTNVQQISYSHPSKISEQSGCLLNIYAYDIRPSEQMGSVTNRQVERHFTGERQGTATVSYSPSWYDISIVITAISHNTIEKENCLFDEAFLYFLRHRKILEERLPPELQGYGNLRMSITQNPPIEIERLWSAFSAPLRPTIHLTVTVPIVVRQKEEFPLVTERVLKTMDSSSAATKATGKQRVSIVGIIKNHTTKEPVAKVEIALKGTRKSVISNSQGIFSFENLRDGNYELRLSCSGYQSQNCNVLVENGTYALKDNILLIPI